MSANAEIIAELRRVLNERDEAREQLDLTKRELGRWVDRETKVVRERDEARAELAGLPAWQHACEQSRLDLAEAEAVIARRETQLDEARAEVERLRAEAAPMNEHFAAGYRDGARDAYRRGAEAMREACARWVDHWVSGHVADKLRDMPIPEEP